MTTVPAERPAADRGGGVWNYVSASRLNLWLKCPLAFKLRYIEGIKTPPSASMFLGRMVHQGLEFYYRHRQLGVSLPASRIIAYLKDRWGAAVEEEGVGFASTAQESSLAASAERLLVAYLAHTPEEEPRPLAVETVLEAPLVDPSTGEDLGIPLLGVLDLVMDEVAGPVVCDFKTAASSRAALEISHEIQLGCYAYLFRRSAGRTEDSLEIRSLVKTKTPQIATHRYERRSQAHFKRLFAVIRSYLDDLDRGRFLVPANLELRHVRLPRQALLSVGRWNSREENNLNARTKLNSANLLGCLLLAAVAGGMTQSMTVFLLAAIVLIALAVHDGGIRPTPTRKK